MVLVVGSLRRCVGGDLEKVRECSGRWCWWFGLVLVWLLRGGCVSCWSAGIVLCIFVSGCPVVWGAGLVWFGLVWFGGVLEVTPRG